MIKYFFGEVIGTFILVFMGCGIVGVSLFNETVSLLHIALIWGLAVFLGIRASMNWCHAHLNPAVSLGFFTMRMINLRQLFVAIGGQLTGAVLAGGALLAIFNPVLNKLESNNDWVRSEVSGLSTGKMFGEYYNPDTTSVWEASMTEGLGTFFLMFMILVYLKNAKKFPVLTHVFISLTVTTLIMFLAPITQCGINPARDFGPRLVSFMSGWDQAFYLPNNGAIVAYVISPLIAGPLAALTYRVSQMLTKT